MKIDQLKKDLKAGRRIVMDGATGTEILHRGVSTSLPLWSAEALLTKPDVIKQIHEDYIKAGAHIITANTFSTTSRVFAKKGMAGKAREATILACRLAREAANEVKPKHSVYVAGSVAPLEDCYSPELTPPENELDSEHLELAKNLHDGGVDFVLIETMITIKETLAACRAARVNNLALAVCFCCDDNMRLLGGESLDEAIAAIKEYSPIFVGVNCISAATATKAVKHLRKITGLPVCVYAQGDGEPDNDSAGWKFTKQIGAGSYVHAAEGWIANGAQIIGGCCGTTPSEISSICQLANK